MRKFLVHKVYGLAIDIERHAQLVKDGISEKVRNAPLETKERRQAKKMLSNMVNNASGKEFKFATQLLIEFLERLDNKLEAPTGRDLDELFQKFTERVRHELSLWSFYRIDPAKAHYYECFRPFGDEVAECFPSSSFDIEEAGRCLAVGRPTACVFHLMRTIGYDEQRDWGRYLTEMKAGIWRKFPDNQTKENDEAREFYSDLESRLRAYKEAWRNPTMHKPEAVYTEEKAEEIFACVKGFMRKAAERIKEQP